MLLDKENSNKEKTVDILNQQLLYQQALAGCSQSLLLVSEDESSQQEALHQALEHLRAVTQASRAYIFQLFEDSELGPCIGMSAEVIAPGILPHIDNPANRKFPLSRLPTDFVKVLLDGKAYGGAVKQLFASTPDLRDAFLAQSPPLLSILLFSIFDRDQLWGFIGYDDCMNEREWDAWEIGMLGTSAEMVGNTIQRWEIEARLRDTLDELEVRVRERTEALSQSNINLNEEIRQRRRVQSDLETRLQIEEKLAVISARLLEPTKIRRNIAVSLEDLAQIMNASRIFLAEFDLHAANQVREFVEWRRPEMLPISEDVAQRFMNSLMGFRDRLLAGETIYIEDIAQFPNNIAVDLRPLQERNVQSFVLSPIVLNQRVQAVLGVSNLHSSADTIQMNLRTLELVAGMLKSLFQREHLIQTLEEQIAERTRQLTTFLDMAMLSDQNQNLVDILQPTLFSITQIAGCDAAGIHIINERNSSLELVAQRGIPLEYLQPLSEVAIDAEFAAWLDETDPYEFVGNLDRGPVFPEPFCFPGFHAFYANRLGTGSKSLGVLSCYRFADQPFSPFQAILLTALGELLGIIVENNRLRGEAEGLAAIEERQRLAREIHDAVSQSVYSLSLFARSAQNAQEEGNQDRLSSNLQDIETTALGAMREMRLLLYELRESGQDADIATALDTRFKQVENRLGIQAAHQIEDEIVLSPQVQHEIWRILVEALNNSLKHANATRVYVQISCREEYLAVSIQDDGIGFDVSSHSVGMGLKNIQARAEALSGHLEICSEAGHGTQIELRIPLACIDPEEGD